MSADELRHIALPQLYGAPAYGRPTLTVVPVERPFDPDAFPLQAVMTDEERALLERGTATETTAPGMPARLEARPFSLRLLTDRLRRGDD
jgi:hypothetical protein